MLKQMSSAFFAPLDQYPSAGMFTSAHLISLLVCFVIVGVCLLASRKMQWKTVMKLTKILAVIITLLELIKIGYNFYFGYTWLDAWFPLSYCSLFIYALWLSGYGKGVFKKLGDAFIIMGALLGGIGFFIFPDNVTHEISHLALLMFIQSVLPYGYDLFKLYVFKTAKNFSKPKNLCLF